MKTQPYEVRFLVFKFYSFLFFRFLEKCPKNGSCYMCFPEKFQVQYGNLKLKFVILFY